MFLNQDQINSIKDQQALGIAAKTMTETQLSLAITSKWLKIWVPQIYGGLGLPLVEGVRFLEELAYHDGGLAWTVTLCSGANLFVGFIDPAIAATVFSADAVCLGGSGAVTGYAEKRDNGYIVTGSWKYATGAPHLTHFTANCILTENQIPILDPQGKQIAKSFFFDRDDVLIHYDWDTFVLECTASHSFSVANLFVQESRSFVIHESKSMFPDTLYRYPFKPFAELTLVANFMGMYKRFIDLVEKHFIQKSHDAEWLFTKGKKLFKRLDQMQQEFELSRTTVYNLLEKSWLQIEENKQEEDILYLQIAQESRKLVGLIKLNVVELFPSCGIAAAQRDHELNIVFRNIFTASQHSLLQSEH